MTKTKTTHEERANAKITAHRTLTRKLHKDFSDTFMVNRLIGKAMISNLSDIDPFIFVVTIKIVSGVTIKSINVNGVIAKEEDFEVKDGNLICEVKAFVSTSTFLLIIDAEGDAQKTTTFNLTCDGDKVYSTDKTILITSTGRGGFSDAKAPLS